MPPQQASQPQPQSVVPEGTMAYRMPGMEEASREAAKFQRRLSVARTEREKILVVLD